MKGKIVAVVHQSVINPKTGLVSVLAARQKNQEIKMVYGDGRVKTSSGDVWKIKPSAMYKGAEFVTIQ